MKGSTRWQGQVVGIGYLRGVEGLGRKKRVDRLGGIGRTAPAQSWRQSQREGAGVAGTATTRYPAGAGG